MIWLASALAQDPLPIDLERYRPTVEHRGYAVTAGALPLDHLQLATALHLDQSRDAAVLREDGNRVLGPEPERYDALLDTRTRMNLGVAIGLRGRFQLGVALPVTLWQQGFEPSAPGPGTTFQQPLPTALGDLRLDAKAAVRRAERGGLGLALRTAVTAPTGSTRSFHGEGSPTLAPGVVLEVSDRAVSTRAHRVRVALDVGGRIKRPDTFRGVSFGSALTWAAAMEVQPVRGWALGAEADQSWMGPLAAQQPTELRAFTKVAPRDLLEGVVGMGWGLRSGIGAPVRRLFVGLTVSPRLDPLAQDRDGDTIPNRYDRCPSVPEDLDGYGDADGCPEDDNDGDEILDEVDRCPDVPEDVDGHEDLDGCPDLDHDGDGIPTPQDRCPLVREDVDGFQDLDGCPEADNDGDGILDPVDRCPMAAEVVNGFEDADGCPDSPQYRDADADGIPDDRDGCPAEPEDFDRFEDADGCPETDNDGDGWLDAVDRCPNDAETVNGFEDVDGCPDEQPLVAVGSARLEIRDRVFFESDRAVIQPISHGLLDEVARVILANPGIGRIRIAGHTDAEGPAYYNLRLSQARVREVADYLVARGVPAERLEAVGFGETRPIADNRTEGGRAANRRVEFVIVPPGG
jgi:outer membrane protein OmpA-like peptidoglycan-associated protein